MPFVRPVLTALLAGFLVFGAASAQSEPVRLRVSWVSVPFEVVPVLFANPALMPHLGKSYAGEAVHYNSAAAMLTSIANGDIEISEQTSFMLGAAIENAKLTDIRIISDDYQDGVPGHFSNGFVVLNDGPVKTIEDLKGKAVASLGIGSSADIAIRVMLRKHGLEDKRDYSVLEGAPQNMTAMLDEGKVALVSTVGMTGHDPALLARAHVLFNRRDAFGGATQESVFVARVGFIAENRAAIVDYLEDYLRGLRWFSDPANHKAAIAAVAAYTKIPPEKLDSWMFTNDDEYRVPSGVPDVASMQRTLDTLKDFGALKTQIDVKKFSDLSLVKEASDRLK
jgi:sulfonate transport system substrate-binding protein